MLREHYPSEHATCKPPCLNPVTVKVTSHLLQRMLPMSHEAVGTSQTASVSSASSSEPLLSAGPRGFACVLDLPAHRQLLGRELISL